MLKQRAQTLQWVLDHDNPNLTEKEQDRAESRLNEFQEVLKNRNQRSKS